jgi:tripartite-type tricarboxylate transporter receptor subunit TctC
MARISIAHYASTLSDKIDPGWEEPPMVRLIELAALTLAASLQLSAGAAAQQTFPTRTVRFILPFGAASASDTAARLFADRLSARWGKPVAVENRPGGDGLVSLDPFGQGTEMRCVLHARVSYVFSGTLARRKKAILSQPAIIIRVRHDTPHSLNYN